MAIAAEGKRSVGVLTEEAWRLYVLMRHRVVRIRENQGLLLR